MEEIKLKTLYVCDSCGKHSYEPEATCNCKEIWNIVHFVIVLISAIPVLLLLWAIFHC